MKTLLSRSLVLALLLFATTADAKKINWEGMRQVRVGMTTAEVVKLTGKPGTVMSMNGKIYYTWAKYSYFTASFAAISIEFTDGKVTVLPAIPEEAR